MMSVHNVHYCIGCTNTFAHTVPHLDTELRVRMKFSPFPFPAVRHFNSKRQRWSSSPWQQWSEEANYEQKPSKLSSPVDWAFWFNVTFCTSSSILNRFAFMDDEGRWSKMWTQFFFPTYKNPKCQNFQNKVLSTLWLPSSLCCCILISHCSMEEAWRKLKRE